MRCLLLFFALAFCTGAAAQTVAAHQQLLREGRKAEALELAKKLLTIDSLEAYASVSIGEYYASKQQCDAAIPPLRRAIYRDSNQHWISAWAHNWLGKCLYQTGRKEEAIRELNSSIRLLKTKNAVHFAEQLLREYWHDTSIRATAPRWTTIESRHITFRFQDTGWQAAATTSFMEAYDRAYEQLDSVFQAKLPQKLVLFIWTDPGLARRILHQELGFTDPVHCQSNIHPLQSRGHELTHTLSYWAWRRPPVSRARFVNEGVAVAFNLAGDNKYETARKAMANGRFHSVLEVWQAQDRLSEDDLYDVAGAFITYCYEHSTPEQFRAAIKDQELEAVRRMYGAARFEQMVRDFDALIGLH